MSGAGAAGGSAVPGAGAGPACGTAGSAPVKTLTAALFSGSWAAPTAFRDEVRPTAKVAATVPKATARSIAAVRTGWAKGAASP